MEDEVNETPHIAWWRLMLGDAVSLWWGVEHWMVTHLFRLQFCPSCSGYFRELSMMEPDKCEACYARDYGLPTPYSVVVVTTPFTSDRE